MIGVLRHSTALTVAAKRFSTKPARHGRVKVFWDLSITERLLVERRSDLGTVANESFDALVAPIINGAEVESSLQGCM